ncbi:MAG TPA: serine protease [Candidatus Paceibacterota bacterium]
MDIERLSKSQIVLLTLLVSFVTSIATGIVTVSLMDQAPPIVAQTVNRVVEHTVETVTPAKSQAAGATVVTQEKTVVIKESDQVAAAVTKLEPSIVRVYSTSAENPLFLGLAIVLREEGVAITDSSTLGGRNDAYLALADGRRVRAFVTERNEETGLAFLAATTSPGDKPVEWKPAKFAGGTPVLGQSVVSLSGRTVARVALGIVTSLLDKSRVIDTDIDKDSILPGSPLTDIDGTVVGVSTGVSRASSPSGFMSSTAMLAQ